MPYLSRRAIENKSVLFEGAAANERREAGKQIRARLFG
jgi:proline dehydrogenase